MSQDNDLEPCYKIIEDKIAERYKQFKQENKDRWVSKFENFCNEYIRQYKQKLVSE